MVWSVIMDWKCFFFPPNTLRTCDARLLRNSQINSESTFRLPNGSKFNLWGQSGKFDVQFWLGIFQTRTNGILNFEQTNPYVRNQKSKGYITENFSTSCRKKFKNLPRLYQWPAPSLLSVYSLILGSGATTFWLDC